jgi:hypothetical protein
VPDPISERAAADIVASVLHGSVIPRDVPGVPDGTHDFDVQLPGHRVVALEITTAAGTQILARWNAVAKLNTTGRRRIATSLRANWLVVLSGDPASGVNRVASKLERLLQKLEATATTGFWLSSPHDVEIVPAPVGTSIAARAVVQRLRDLGVTACQTRTIGDEDGPALILLGTTA